MPIFKVICVEDFRDDFYELKISEKIMFTVQLILGIVTLIVAILNDEMKEDYPNFYYIVIGWYCLECLFCIGGIIVFHFLNRPIVIFYLCLMLIHLCARVVYILYTLIQLHKADLHIALTTLSAILSLVQLWAAFLLFRLLRNKNAHGYNTNMYRPEFSKLNSRSSPGDSLFT